MGKKEKRIGQVRERERERIKMMTVCFRCQQYVLLETSREQETLSLKEDVYKQIEILRGMDGDGKEEREKRKETMMALSLSMKEHRGSIQSLMTTGEAMMEEGERHKGDIEKTLK